VKIYWTYSKKDLRPDHIPAHEKAKVRLSNEKYHIGGLNKMVPTFTHCITADGYLHAMNYCPGNEVHLALIGGVNDEYVYHNTATEAQLLALGNLVRFHLSLGENIEEGDLSNFDLITWLKAVNK
jgi:hypothetical protein